MQTSDQVPVDDVESNDSEIWEFAKRWRQYEAETRVNAIRIVAIGTFYLVHLAHHFSANNSQGVFRFLQLHEGDVLSQTLHIAITSIAVAWTMWALLVHSLLRAQVFPRWLSAASTCLDVTLLTAVLVLSSGAASPLVTVYFLIVMMAGLRLDLWLIRAATGCGIVGYLIVLGCTRWPRGLLLELTLPTVPRYQQLMVLAALILAGVIVGQWVRLARHMADDLVRSTRRGTGT